LNFFAKGSLQASFWADAISRRYSLVLASSVFLVGSLFQTFSFSFGSLTAGRAIGGLGIGAMSMLSPLYMSEISPAELRGAILALEQLSIVSGVVLGFWFGFATRNSDYRRWDDEYYRVSLIMDDVYSARLDL
jgi:MFS family permease